MSSDVNDYVVDTISPLLFGTSSTEELERALSQWYAFSIEFTGRLVEKMGDSLPNFLHAAMLGRSFSAEGNSQLQGDLRQ